MRPWSARRLGNGSPLGATAPGFDTEACAHPAVMAPSEKRVARKTRLASIDFSMRTTSRSCVTAPPTERARMAWDSDHPVLSLERACR